MDKNKLLGYLNIAIKAGYVIVGGENISKTLQHNRKIYLVLYDDDIKKNTCKIINNLVNNNIRTLELKNLNEYIKINNCKIIALKNKNLSDIIYNIIVE